MANGRSSVFRGAGKAAGKYRASQERGRGIEYAKSGAAALSQLNIDTSKLLKQVKLNTYTLEEIDEVV